MGPKDDARQDLVNRIQNTSINCNAMMQVDETFTLSKGPRTATSWSMTPTIPGLTFNTQTGRLSGTVDTSQEGQTFKVMIKAHDNSVIDFREYTFCPAMPSKGDAITLVHPYKALTGGSKITSGFGPRVHPITKVQKNHSGQDWVASEASAKGKGTIVAAGDGEVVYVGDNPGGYGLNIKINHKSASGKILCQTLYGHCSQILVTLGQKVGAGQTIAKEGSTGASTGPHLHFEVRLGGTVPVDPTPYFRGTTVEQPPTQSDNTVPAEKSRTNTAPVLTMREVAARTRDDCPKVLDSGVVTAEPPFAPQPASNFTNQVPTTSKCIPDVRPPYSEVSSKIDQALNESDLDAEDKKLIRFIAQIESRFDPFAKNPQSSATGLYQMLDKTAQTYYANIGEEPTCANRCDPYKATKAMIAFYKQEIRPYWVNYVASGKTTIAGKPIKNTPHSERYASLTKGEFAYGLIHHDGVGNAVNGVDRQGVDYYRKKIRETGFA
jgi:hypothetical protein